VTARASAKEHFWYSRLGETRSPGRKYQVRPLFTRATSFHSKPNNIINSSQAIIIATKHQTHEIEPKQAKYQKKH